MWNKAVKWLEDGFDHVMEAITREVVNTGETISALIELYL